MVRLSILLWLSAALPLTVLAAPTTTSKTTTSKTTSTSKTTTAKTTAKTTSKTTAKTSTKTTATSTRTPTPTPTCYTLNFDDLGSSGAHSQDLPLPYKDFGFSTGYWGFVSAGTQTTYGSIDPNNVINVVPHSGNNAIVNYQDAGGPRNEPHDAACIDSWDNARYYDLRSFWVRGEYGAAFTHRLKCYHIVEPQTTDTLYTDVPALGAGGWYQIKLNSTFSGVRRCAFGADGQQILLDDIEVCAYNKNNLG